MLKTLAKSSLSKDNIEEDYTIIYKKINKKEIIKKYLKNIVKNNSDPWQVKIIASELGFFEAN